MSPRPAAIVIGAHPPIAEGYQAGHRCHSILVKRLAEEFDVYLFAFANRTELRMLRTQDLSACKEAHLYSVSYLKKAMSTVRNPRLPITVATRASAHLARDLTHLLSRVTPAFAVLEWTQSLLYASQTIRSGCATYSNEQDLTYLVRFREASATRNYFRRVCRNIEARRLRRWELKQLKSLDGIVVMSAADRRELDKQGIAVPTYVLQPFFRSVPDYPIDRWAETIIYWGAMDRAENCDAALWFAKRVFPLITMRRPDARLIIVGAHPTAQVLALQGSRVVVTGASEDPWSILSMATVMVAPLRRGGGLKVKVLEAMGHGAPCVLSSVAAEGIGATSGVQCLICEGEAQFKSACVRLLEEPKLRTRIGRAGFDHVRATFDWQRSLQEVVQFYRHGKRARNAPLTIRAKPSVAVGS